MRKKLCIALVLSLFMYTREAYAIFDIMAKIESVLEQAEDYKNKIQEYAKKAREIEKRARQGFELAKSCYKNPKSCDTKALETWGKDAKQFYVETMDEIRVMPGAEELSDGDLNEKLDVSLIKTIQNTYIYHRGQGKDLENLNENRRQLNAILSDDTALLFAKAVATRQSILMEDGSLYQQNFKNNNIDEILSAQNVVDIATQQRLNRILELRAYMVSGAAAAEMSTQTIEAEESGE